VLIRFVDLLGNPDPESELPYCPNFDPAKNPNLPATATATRRPTATPADLGL